MTIFERFKNWLVGISPEVLAFARPVLEGLTPALIRIAQEEVAAAQNLTDADGLAKFQKAQKGVRLRIANLGHDAKSSLINAAIELAVSNLPK